MGTWPLSHCGTTVFDCLRGGAAESDRDAVRFRDEGDDGREDARERELGAGVRDMRRPRLGVSFSSVRGSSKMSPMRPGVPFVMGLRAGRFPCLRRRGL